MHHHHALWVQGQKTAALLRDICRVVAAELSPANKAAAGTGGEQTHVYTVMRCLLGTA
jgi:hypothetical protein